MMMRPAWMTLAMLILGSGHWQSTLAAQLADLPSPSVGVMGLIEQIVLPGSELRAKRIDDPDTPLVVRVVDAFPHGDAWRYDIEFYGLEPGTYDLRHYLERVDGSGTENLPVLQVEIQSVLAPGQVLPHDLPDQGMPGLGGYRLLVMVAVGMWVLILLLIVFVGRKSRAKRIAAAQPLTLGDYLRPRLQQAIAGQLSSARFAELERMLVAFWTQRLGLEDLPPAEAVRRIKSDANAGPLLAQMEQWMHDPQRTQQISLADLLAPYREIPLDDLPQRVAPPAGRAGQEAASA